MDKDRAARLHRAACRFVRACAPLVPGDRRSEWREEWESELWHHLNAGDASVRDLVMRVSGALPHALALRRNDWRPDMLRQDLMYALRTSLRRPAFTALVVGMLALGIGANTAMFTVVNSVLIQPLPYRNAEELVGMTGSFSKNDFAGISGPDFKDYRSGNHVFSSFAAYQRSRSVVFTGGDKPERAMMWKVTPNFFATLGVTPLRGRMFVQADEDGSNADVAVLSYALWQRRFGGDTTIIGRTIAIDARPTQVIGIMPAALDQTFDALVWFPVQFNTPGLTVRRFHGLRGLGRLAPGVTMPQAQAAMDVIAKQLEATYPENATWKLRLRPYRDMVVGDIGRSLVILLGAVGLVLLIACGNVASLLLARATSRQGEIGIRTALGATRGRLVKQLITESLFLSVAGGVTGYALAATLVRGVRAVGAGFVPRLAEVTMDRNVLAFSIVLSLVTGLVFGLAPALHAVRSDVAATFAALGRSSGGRRAVRARDALVVMQVALSLVLLAGAGLLMRSLWQLERVDPGFDPRRVLAVNISLPVERYADRDVQVRFWTALLDGVRAAPGVESASMTTLLPLAGGGDTYYWRADQPPATPADRRNAVISSVGEGYFETMRIPIVRGRSFGAAEKTGGPNAVIISARLARLVFADENPIGKQLVVDFGTPFNVEVVGVAGDVRTYGLAEKPPPTLYFSVFQPGGFGNEFMNVVVRTGGDPMGTAGAVRATLASLDRDIPVTLLRTMDDVVSGSTSRSRFGARLLAAFAGAALLLAVIGLYGVLTYSVAQRKRELGIRMAFGAQRNQLFGLVLRRGMTIVAIGIAVGLAAALAGARLMDTLLFEVGRTDPAVFVTVTVALAAAGLVACVIPARAATRVDPVVALRAEA